MLSPEEIEHVKLRRRVLGGYPTRKTRELLRQIAWDLRDVLHERTTLEAENRRLRVELDRREHRDEIEDATLKSARHVAREITETARHDAELILRKAYKRAGEVLRTADKEYEARSGELRVLDEQSKLVRNHLRAVLEAVLRSLDDTSAASPQPEARTQPQTQDLEQAVSHLVARIHPDGNSDEAEPDLDEAEPVGALEERDGLSGGGYVA